jgi:hypothetical protein
MIYSKLRDLPIFRFCLLLFFISCSKKEEVNTFVKPENYVSDKGIEYEVDEKFNLMSTINIAENSLKQNEFILISENKLSSNIDEVGGIAYKTRLSTAVSFTKYNCKELGKAGIIKIIDDSYSFLYGSNLPFGTFGFKDTKIKPYKCSIKKDLNNTQNWQEIIDYSRSDSSIVFEFTDLEFSYFLGFDQP